MKAVLEFDLPEEHVAHQMAVSAEGAHYVISEIDEAMRGHLKHGHSFKTADEVLEHYRTFIRELMHDNDVMPTL